jgi:hypothetical protein
MCMGDWRLGRLIRHQITAWDTAAGTGLIIMPSLQRVGLSISLSTFATAVTNSVTISIDGIVSGQMSQAVPFRHIDMLHFGDLPTRKFSVAGLSGNAAGVWIEYFAPEPALAIPLESILKGYESWQR